MGNRNYQKELDRLIEKNSSQGCVPTLYLHSCCAPCSSYVLFYLSNHFRIKVFYYNPNISPKQEYEKRAAELKRLLAEMPLLYPPALEIGPYEPERFYEAARGLEKIPEGGERCMRCYRLRMEETAKRAAAEGFDFFTTTLSISPLKNAARINEIGESLEALYGVRHLPSDFKKKEGYKQSVELSKKYNLYRQNFCGCIFSRKLFN